MKSLFRNGLQKRAVMELGILSLLTILYFNLLPNRTTKIDMLFALVGLCFVLITARETWRKFWDKPVLPFGERLKQSTAIVGLITFAAIFAFAVISGWLSYHESGKANKVFARLANPDILKVLPFYIAWAFLQQFLFQFYLLSRIRALLPAMPNIVLSALNGILFSMVHVPEWWVVLATIPAGILWSYLYLKYRCLIPITVSHAVLGAAFFYWILNKNMFESLFSLLK